MRSFQGYDYLLHSELAVELYINYAEHCPIFDFHCHLSPKEIFENKPFQSITTAWLGKNGEGDHYKWRLLRESGVDEKYITGDGDDYERFLRFAEAMPYFLGNPIFEWTHLELKRFFGINFLINKENAPKIYECCNKALRNMTPRSIIEKSNVRALFTTDDPVDDLRYHEALAKDDSFKTKVLPCWRPDRFLHIGNKEAFKKAIGDLGNCLGKPIANLDDFLNALTSRLDYFKAHGCCASDHGFEALRFKESKKEDAEKAYKKALEGKELNEEEITSFESFLLVYLGKEYVRLGFAQQYHIGALRNASEVGFAKNGPDFGYDATGDYNIATPLAKLLSTLEKENALPRTVLYALNEKDYPVMVTLMNSFQGKGRGYIQLGAAWWFNDHYEGIRNQIRTLMAGGLLPCFIGMLTDSRSFLSYPRHEYFRRILVDEIASLIEYGRYPYEKTMIGKIVEDICYNNAKNFFLGEERK